MRIYISLPITAREKEAREKADRVKTMLSKMGWEVINPFEIYHSHGSSYGQIIGVDIATLIEYCDAIFLCRNWNNSHGCRIEHFVAREFNKKIIFEEREESSEYWR